MNPAIWVWDRLVAKAWWWHRCAVAWITQRDPLCVLCDAPTPRGEPFCVDCFVTIEIET